MTHHLLRVGKFIRLTERQLHLLYVEMMSLLVNIEQETQPSWNRVLWPPRVTGRSGRVDTL